jgi:hypothetical protein
MARKLKRLTTATALMTLALSGTANAAILTSAPREDLVCGDAIQVGIWENPNKEPTPKGQRKVTMRAIDTATGTPGGRRRPQPRTNGATGICPQAVRGSAAQRRSP